MLMNEGRELWSLALTPLQQPKKTKTKNHTTKGTGFVRIWGTQPDAIDEAEDRDRWMALLNRLNIKQPAGGVARTEAEAFAKARDLGYPVMVRPSYVLGGRAMEIVYDDDDLKR